MLLENRHLNWIPEGSVGQQSSNGKGMCDGGRGLVTILKCCGA